MNPTPSPRISSAEVILATAANADDCLLTVLSAGDERCQCLLFSAGAETETARTVLPISGDFTSFVSAAALDRGFVVFGEDPHAEPRLHAFVIDGGTGAVVDNWTIPCGDYPSVIQVFACRGGFAAIWHELSPTGPMADMWVAVVDTAEGTQTRTVIAHDVDWGSSAERWVGGPTVFGGIGSRVLDSNGLAALTTCVWTVDLRGGGCEVNECRIPERQDGLVDHPAILTIDRSGTSRLSWIEREQDSTSVIVTADVDLERSRCGDVHRSDGVEINPTIIEAFDVDGQRICVLGGHEQSDRCIAQTYVFAADRLIEGSAPPIRCDQGLRVICLATGRPLMVWNDGLTIRSADWGPGEWMDAREHAAFTDHAGFEPVPLRSGWALVAMPPQADADAAQPLRPTVTWIGRGRPG